MSVQVMIDTTDKFVTPDLVVLLLGATIRVNSTNLEFATPEEAATHFASIKQALKNEEIYKTEKFAIGPFGVIELAGNVISVNGHDIAYPSPTVAKQVYNALTLGSGFHVTTSDFPMETQDKQGYIELPNGFKIMWGEVQVTTDENAEAIVQFPKSFTEACFGVWAVDIGPACIDYAIIEKTKNYFKFHAKNSDGSERKNAATGILYIAIGR